MSQVTLDEQRVQIVAAAEKGNTLVVPKRGLLLPDGERYAFRHRLSTMEERRNKRV